MNFSQIQNNLNEINQMLDKREKEVTYSQSQPSVYCIQDGTVYHSKPRISSVKPEYIPASSRQYKDETDDIVQSFNKYKTAAFGQAPSKVFREIQNVESLNAGDYARWTDRSVTDDEIIPKNRKALCVTSPVPTESDKIINPLKADYSKLNTFYDKSLEKINNMEMQMIKLERQLKENSERDENLKTEEERLVEMISEVEAKQNELEELKAYRQRLQGMAIDSINRTPRLSSPSYSKYSSRKNSATSQSPSYFSNKTEKKEDRLARIERMLVQVLNHQARNDQEIANLADRLERSQVNHASLQVHQDLNSSFQLSETEPENEFENNDVYKVGMEYVQASRGSSNFILNFLNLLMLVDTDEKRERCLENVQSIIHDHYYEQSSLNDKDEDTQKDVIYPPITDVEAVDLEYLNDLEQNNLSFSN